MSESVLDIRILPLLCPSVICTLIVARPRACEWVGTGHFNAQRAHLSDSCASQSGLDWPITQCEFNGASVNTFAPVPAVECVETRSVAEAYLSILARKGIDYLFIGSGTDTAPIVEAYARLKESGHHYPEPIIAAHENLAVGMAHGYYMMTGRPQAVMLHVSVGAANAVCALMNAARGQVPMLFTAGRTPLFESGPTGARNSEIHWAQEMFDQGAMLREVVKWDYELRDGVNVEDVVDRALTVAQTEPRGPVYLTLPREVLARELGSVNIKGAPTIPTPAAPHPAGVKQLALALSQAEAPVIICTASGSDPETVSMLTDFSNRYGIAVGEAKPRFVNFPSSHPLHVGFNVPKIFEWTDAVLFLESDVPWIPGVTRPKENAFVAHAATDPVFASYPLRTFASDLTLTTSVRALLSALTEELDRLGATSAANERSSKARAFVRSRREAAQNVLARDAEKDGPISKLFLTACLNEVRPANSVIVNEYSVIRDYLDLDDPATFFLYPTSAGLGWGLPAALGAQKAATDKVIISVLGDGAYIFCNPTACHLAATMHNLPVLTIVFNNGRWGAVQSSTLRMYPDENAARHESELGVGPLSSLEPSPDYEKYMEASGGYGERVTSRDQLIPALKRALNAVSVERRPALLNVIGQ